MSPTVSHFPVWRLMRSYARKRVSEVYSEIAALTPEELVEINTNPALRRAFDEYVVYWRRVQAIVDRFNIPGANPHPLADELRSFKLD